MTLTDNPTYSIAVIIPCYNEEATVAHTIKEVKKHLPEASVFVCDNASTDQTSRISREAGATVLFESRKGKAQAVQRLINSVDADVFVLCDGDMTYDLSVAPLMIETLITQRLDMLIGKREPAEGQNTWRVGHAYGNWFFTNMLKVFFGGNLSDVLSGYRIFSRRFAKSFPILSKGFDIEVEMTVHSLSTGLSIEEVSTSYFARPKGSVSKLNTFRDGWRILNTLLRLLLDCQPLRLAFIATFAQIVMTVILFIPIWQEFSTTGQVDRMPTAILCLGLVITSLLTISCGVILDALSRQAIAAKKMAYLSTCDPKK